MSMSRVLAIGLRQVYLMRGSLSRVLPLFMWVAIDIILWGFITKYLSSVASGGHGFVVTLLGAVLLWDFLIRVMQGITTAFLEDVWSRNFLNLFATPLSIVEYVCGLVFTSTVTSIIGLIIMMLLAWGCFGLSFFPYGIHLAYYLSLLFLSGIALGVFACAVVLRLGPAAEWFVWPIPAVISPFVGIFYPVSTLPVAMQWVAHFLPPSYVFDGMRTVAAGQGSSPQSMLIGGSLSILYLLLAIGYFMRTFNQAVKTGLIARYSAESVN